MKILPSAVYFNSNTTLIFIFKILTVGGSRIYPLLPGDIKTNYNISSEIKTNIILRWNNNYNLTKASLQYTPINKVGQKLATKSMEISRQSNNTRSSSIKKFYTLSHPVDNSTLERFSVAVVNGDSSMVDIIISGGIGLKEQFEVTLKTSQNLFRRTFFGYGRFFY